MTNGLQLLAQQNNGGSGLFAGLAGGGCVCVAWLIGLAAIAFSIWMLIDVLSSNKPSNEKLLWAVVIILTGGLGAVLYFFIARGKSTPGV